MRSRLYLYCPKCGNRSQTIHEDGKELHINCGDCLMNDIEVVELIAERVHPICEERT